MTMPYETQYGVLAVAQEKFEKHVEEGQEHYPDATASHLGFDCETPDDLKIMKSYFANWGELSDPEPGDKEIIFIKLNTPLKYKDYTLPYLELIGPEADKSRPTGPRVLVFQVNTAELQDAVKVPSIKDAGITLRFQNRSAAQISGLGL